MQRLSSPLLQRPTTEFDVTTQIDVLKSFKKLIVCDGITSALNTIVVKAILKLLHDLKERLQVGDVFISHDISTIARIADTITIMRGRELLSVGRRVNFDSATS